jgi:thiopeptide-type bacteriocin biosynthesis protein
VDHADPADGTSPWCQVAIEFPDWHAAERIVTEAIGPVFAGAERAGAVLSWFFIRKAPCWRLRCRPADNSAVDAAVHAQLDGLRDAGLIDRWTPGIYEPEIHAFGGAEAMTVAHRLFHHDSNQILHHLSQRETDGGQPNHRRELSLLLNCLLLRAAGLDWYEQGDVWARVAEHRALSPDATPDRLQRIEPGVRRLLTVDTTGTSGDGQLPIPPAWANAFTTAGADLGSLAIEGNLTRGLRAVLAHHVIFAWNRIGLPHNTQAVLAHAAKTVVFGH